MNAKTAKALRKHAREQSKTPEAAKIYYKHLKKEYNAFIRED